MLGERIKNVKQAAEQVASLTRQYLQAPWDGLGGHKNSARLQPCGTKGKEREMRNLLPLL